MSHPGYKLPKPVITDRSLIREQESQIECLSEEIGKLKNYMAENSRIVAKLLIRVEELEKAQKPTSAYPFDSKNREEVKDKIMEAINERKQLTGNIEKITVYAQTEEEREWLKDLVQECVNDPNCKVNALEAKETTIRA